MSSCATVLTFKLRQVSMSNHQAIDRAFNRARALSDAEENELAQAVQEANRSIDEAMSLGISSDPVHQMLTLLVPRQRRV